MEEYVILVDQNDNKVGLMEKMEAHEKGLLHRAFSVFVVNSAGELMMHSIIPDLRLHAIHHHASIPDTRHSLHS